MELESVVCTTESTNLSLIDHFPCASCFLFIFPGDVKRGESKSVFYKIRADTPFQNFRLGSN